MKTFLNLLGVGILSLFHQLPTILLWGTILYAIWCMQAPPSFGPFPPNTEILQQTDTHKGLFRTKGTYVVVAQIAPEHIDSFVDQLMNHGVSWGFSPDTARELLAPADNIDILFEPEKHRGVLWTLEDGTIAFTGEPFSDYYVAAFDMDSGLFCAVEFDC